MATRKQKLIAMLGLEVYKDLMKVLKELRQEKRGEITLRSIEIEKGVPISAEKRREIEALFAETE